ncbi:hypothetical protein F9B85_10015 [Heliorestis acidaminivorans]|uniref:Antitoxin of toxin-antitoxin, RelE / RelB, TA system n=1 Tax=Heliorestis acidaminivorans TaxID=553427 RepID=A0A6I0EVY9_9FIRM|nr:hypothetical protein [Heliorestis acidaminivorans]KAB2952138.1 hypothetical protein F9B85_10015 [Heliorestis acidaminivorans]
MQEILDSTAVRKNWSKFIDDVVHSKPAIVKRTRDTFAAISLEHLHLILAQHRFSIVFTKEADGTYSGSLKEIDLVANAENLESLKETLAEDLIEYADEYMENFELYSRSPNRKNHLPYILHVLTQSDLEHVKGLIDA